jgi:hypothetical protein
VIGLAAQVDFDEFMSTLPSVMGPVMSSLPEAGRVAELTLLSVVDAEAATLCCQRER